ncbi:hypothetical protein EJ06DRAFT_506327 [Trichodelitschia bisporula]|uniref:WW domain-containing protein n=1 Tax=Trichodelitschia bisporula TaxID=703511 RepID=A0A6G1I4J1_9PEZI|nr:hypothetical protein EJ06DRAFT_506327 [Trichodelitschia bisporula]
MASPAGDHNSSTDSPARSGADDKHNGLGAEAQKTPLDRQSPAPEQTPQDKVAALPSEPPLPNEEAPPPLPDEAPPLPAEEPPDDGWEPLWDPNAGAFYFFNRFTKASQWENPRIPEATAAVATPAVDVGPHDPIAAEGSGPSDGTSSELKRGPAGGYNPAIHGDYDPNADYAIEAHPEDEERTAAQQADPNAIYSSIGAFNRFTGRWQDATVNPDTHNDENKTKRQMSAYFDVDAAANSHDGRSLKAERQGKKLSKEEVRAFREKRRAKKEEKRRAWLRD